MSNRFEQVDEPVDDAINVVLEQRANGQWANILIARSAARLLPKDWTSEDLPPKDALSNAVKFDNKLKLDIVIVDRDGVWKKEWGELYRDDGADAPGEEVD